MSVMEMVSESSQTEYILSVTVTGTVSFDSPCSDRDCVMVSRHISAVVYDPLRMVTCVQTMLRWAEATLTLLQGRSSHPHPSESNPHVDTFSGPENCGSLSVGCLYRCVRGAEKVENLK